MTGLQKSCIEALINHERHEGMTDRYRAAKTRMRRMDGAWVRGKRQCHCVTCLQASATVSKHRGMLARTLEQASHICWRAVTSHTRVAGSACQRGVQDLNWGSVRLSSSGQAADGGSADDSTEK